MEEVEFIIRLDITNSQTLHKKSLRKHNQLMRDPVRAEKPEKKSREARKQAHDRPSQEAKKAQELTAEDTASNETDGDAANASEAGCSYSICYAVGDVKEPQSLVVVVLLTRMMDSPDEYGDIFAVFEEWHLTSPDAALVFAGLDMLAGGCGWPLVDSTGPGFAVRCKIVTSVEMPRFSYIFKGPLSSRLSQHHPL